MSCKKWHGFPIVKGTKRRIKVLRNPVRELKLFEYFLCFSLDTDYEVFWVDDDSDNSCTQKDQAWVEENCLGHYYIKRSERKIYFELECDAVAYKLGADYER